jgi:hypothetical protein
MLPELSRIMATCVVCALAGVNPKTMNRHRRVGTPIAVFFMASLPLLDVFYSIYYTI